MVRTQVYTLVNNALKQTVGESVLLSEDLSNVVDCGASVFDANATEQFTKALIDQIGRIKIESKEYKGRYPKMLREAWEYGSVLQVIRQTKLPKATVNESWALENNTSYDPFVTSIPEDIEVKFYNDRICFEIPYTLVDYQLKEAFQGASQLMAFVGMIATNVNNAMELALGNLCKRCFNNYVGEAHHASKTINILSEYETETGATLTAAKALYDASFLRYVVRKLGLNAERMKDLSIDFNISGNETFSTDLNTAYLADFASAVGVYLQNAQGQFQNGNLALPEGEIIPYWQGEGTSGYAFADVSKVKVKTSEGNTVELGGIIAVQYDNDACVVSCLDRHTTSQVNQRAEYINYWDKATCGLINDFGKNFVVYYIAD